MKRMNKRGGEEFLTLWNFIIWAIIAVAIITGTLVFHGQEMNLKQYESEILRDRIIRCITETPESLGTVITNGINLHEECNLDDKHAITEKNANYYVNLTIKSGETTKEILIGNNDYETQCVMNANGRSKTLPRCSNTTVVKKYENSEGIIMEATVIILSGSNNKGII